MAEGSNNLTTYYAKRIIGDSAAATASKALLQSGTGITDDTWIFHRTNRTSVYGIRYDYDSSSNGTKDKLELYGGYQVSSTDTPTVWARLDTGDVYILGKVGIGYDPNTSGNSYKLYVNGTSYFYGTTYLNDKVGIGYNPATSGNGYKLRLNGGQVFFNYTTASSTSNTSSQLIVSNSNGGNVALELWRGSNASWQIANESGVLYIRNNYTSTKQNTYSQDGLILDYNTGAASLPYLAVGQTSRDTTYKLYVNGTSYFNGNIRSNGHLYFEASKNIYFNYNSKDWPVLDNYNNSNTTFNACGGGLHIGYVNTPNTYIFYSNSGSAGTKFFEVNSNGAYALTRFGVNGQSTDYNLYVSGTANITNTLYLTRTTDAEGTANNKPALIIGNVTGEHLEFDGNEIMAKASGTTTSTLYLNNNGGSISAGGAFTAAGTIHANGGYLKSTLSSNTVQIGSQNTSWCHITSSVNIPFWFNRTITTEYGYDIGTTTYRPFHLYLGRSSTTNSNAINATNPFIEFSNSDRSQYCQLIYSDHDTIQPPDSLTLVGNQTGTTFIMKNGPIWVQGGSNAGSNTNRLNTTAGMPGNMQYNQSRRGTQIYSNGIAFCDPYNGNSNNDSSWLRHIETSANSGYLEIAVGDDGNEEIVARQYNTSNEVVRTMYLLNSSGNTTIPGDCVVASGHRVGGSGGALYLGNSGNQSWVYVQDMASQSGTDKWKITQAGAATFAGSVTAGSFIGAHTDMSGARRDMQIRMGTINVKHNTQTSVTFSPAFSNACSAVIPWVAQLGFAAAQSVSVGSTSKTGCKLYQYNVAAVDCVLSYIAFGY